MNPATKHKLHRTIGIIVVPLVLLSAATGFFRANHKWFWEEGYKKKKHPSAFSISAVMPVERIMSIVDSIEGRGKQFNYVNLKSEAGALYYEAGVKDGKKYLLQAADGKVVSPLDSALAAKIAAQYVKDNGKIKTCSPVMDYVTRKEKELRPVHKVAFDNEVNSEIYIDYRTGDIIEDYDDNRSFGMLMVKLHDYDFWSSKRVLTSIVGIAIVLLGLSGLWIYRRKKKRRLTV